MGEVCNHLSVLTTQKTAFDFIVKDAAGQDVDLSQYKGKVVLFVNVASKWGKTKKHYKQLVKLHEKYKDQGFEVLAFPCNQFLGNHLWNLLSDLAQAKSQELLKKSNKMFVSCFMSLSLSLAS